MRKKELKKFSLVFVMSGQKGFYKGFHLVIELSQFLNKFNAALVWLGASKGYGLNFYVEKAKTNLKIDNLILPGILRGEEYYSWLNAADAFLLTSLVDPYPLVMLEAAYLQKPIIAFNSDGVSEFVKEGMGKIVSYFCVEKLKNAIEEFISGKIIINKDLLKREAEKHDIKIKISEFEDMILKYI